MSENTLQFLVFVVIGGAILGTIGYYIGRFLRGSIKLTLPLTAFQPGGTIAGRFDLKTKKKIEGNKLIVSLIGTEVTKYRENDQTKTRSHEIYRDEVLLEDARSYRAGTKKSYRFEIPVPNSQSSDFMDSGLGQALSVGLELLSERSTHLKWKVEARLDAKGIDLADSKTVSINTGQWR